jgi:hypothetical protein
MTANVVVLPKPDEFRVDISLMSVMVKLWNHPFITCLERTYRSSLGMIKLLLGSRPSPLSVIE